MNEALLFRGRDILKSRNIRIKKGKVRPIAFLLSRSTFPQARSSAARSDGMIKEPIISPPCIMRKTALTENIRIAPLGEKDFRAALRLVRDIFNAADEKKAMSELTIFLKARKSHVEYGHDYWIAKTGEKMVGIIGLEYVANEAAWLSWFGVRKEYRGKGIGWELLSFATEQAKQKGIRTISIECGTLPMFKSANKLYDEFGFKDKFTIDDFWAHNDDLLVKSKTIVPARRIRIKKKFLVVLAIAFIIKTAFVVAAVSLILGS